MLKKLIMAAAAIGVLMSTASADYYVVREKKTQKCKVVETRPTGTTWVRVGNTTFKTKNEAESKITTICKSK